jgi:hypothetical protein
MSRGRMIVVVVLLAILAGGVYELFFDVPAGPRTLGAFDPERTADLEVDMWRRYYDHESLRLFADLTMMLHGQNRYPWAEAGVAAYHLSRAASTFSETHTAYELLLPDLEAAYAIARDWTHAGFDPAAVAKAELAWWVARRIPGQDSPDQVGGLIADENALLYDVPRNRVLAASILRARAGRLRDNGGANADWGAVSDLLHQSYRQLHDAVAR